MVITLQPYLEGEELKEAVDNSTEIHRQAETLLRSRKYNALVVDSAYDIRMLSIGALEGAGFGVTEASSPDNALKTDLSRLDLIVSEIIFPQPSIDGTEFLSKVLGRHIHPNDIPFIFFTHYANYKDNFMTWPAHAYVVKNQGLAELVRTAKKVIVDFARDRQGVKP